MRLFSCLYRYVIQWSQHRHAVYYLAAVSFMESVLFPIPPDVMLAPLSLAKPARAWWYASLTTLSSVVGALVGYGIGRFFFHWIEPWLAYAGYLPAYQQAQNWFNVWGGWVILVAAFSPIPFKVFTITGGALHLALLPFVLASIIGRGMRFYLVAGLMRLGGEKMHSWIERFIDRLGWAMVGLILIGYGAYWCILK